MRYDPAVLYRRAAQQRCLKVADAIVDMIRTQPETPRRSGRLADAYHARRYENGAEIVVEISGPQDVRYYLQVEFGTPKMRAQPHIRPAVEKIRRGEVP